MTSSVARELPTDNLFEVAVNASPTGMVLVDDSGRVVLTNARIEEIFGYKPDELIGEPIHKLVPEHCRLHHSGQLETYFKNPAARKMGSENSSLAGLRKDGSEFPVEIALNPVYSGGQLHVLASIIDQTERKLTEEKLDHFSKLDRIMVDEAPIGIALVDKQGRWLRVNTALCEMLGYTRDELISADLYEITHEEDRTRDEDIIRKLASREVEVGNYNKRYRHRDGHFVWINIHCSAVYDADGNAEFFIGQILNIDEQVRAELVQKQREAELSSFIENIPGMVSMKNSNLEYTRVNQHALELFQFEEEDILGKRHEELFERTDSNIDWNIDTRVLQSGVPLSEEWTRRIKGQEKIFQSLVFPITGEDGETASIGTISLDVTEKKQEEKKLYEATSLNRVLVDHAPLGIALSDPEGNWIRVNDAFCKMLGYTQEELTNSSFSMITREDEIEKDLDYIKRLLAREIDSFSDEKNYVCKNGNIIRVKLDVSRVDDESGIPKYFACQIRDITEQRLAEDRLNNLSSQFAAYLEHSPGYITLKDTGHRYLLGNNAVAELLGTTREDLIGKRVGDFVEQELANSIEDVEAEVMKTFEEVTNERYHKDTGRVVLSTVFPVIDKNGKLLCTGTISVDITERKQQEEAQVSQARKLELLQRIAVQVNQSDEPQEAMQNCLDTIGNYMNWEVGHIYIVNEQEGEKSRLISSNLFYLKDEARYRDFYLATRDLEYSEGKGLPGIVYRDKKTIWIDSAATKKSFPRKKVADECGLRAGVGFPVMISNEIAAVFEFFSSTDVQPDTEIVELFHYVSSQLSPIFERKRANRSIATALKRVNSHISNTPLAVIEFDRNLKIVQWNRTAEETFGWTREEALGNTPVELGMIFEEDLSRIQDRVFKPILNDETVKAGIKNRNNTKSGDVLHVEWFNSSLTDENGEVVSMISFALDRTGEVEAQQKLFESEERFDLAVSASNSGIFDWDVGNDSIWASPKLIDLFQLPRDNNQKLTVKDAANFFHPDDQPLFESLKHELLSTPIEINADYRIVAPDGKVTWVEENALSVANDDGKIYRVVGTFTDISGRKNAEQALKQYTEDLKRSNSELEQFAYVASHDLQEPLRMVASFTDLLAKRYSEQLDDKALEYIGYSVDGAKRMQQLINDLLMYSRVGREDKPHENVDLNQVFQDARDNLRLAIDEKSASVSSVELPTVKGDKQQLLQLFQNLIGNALKYSREKSTPDIRISYSAKDNQLLEISVSDNGIGIAPEFADKIFVIFKRLHGKGEYGGTGIGLAICKKIIERHGGSIWVERNPPQGSSFKFTLPA